MTCLFFSPKIYICPWFSFNYLHLFTHNAIAYFNTSSYCFTKSFCRMSIDHFQSFYVLKSIIFFARRFFLRFNFMILILNIILSVWKIFPRCRWPSGVRKGTSLVSAFKSTPSQSTTSMQIYNILFRFGRSNISIISTKNSVVHDFTTATVKIIRAASTFQLLPVAVLNRFIMTRISLNLLFVILIVIFNTLSRNSSCCRFRGKYYYLKTCCF